MVGSPQEISTADTKRITDSFSEIFVTLLTPSLHEFSGE
jgi:hypothetical protein